MSEEVKDWLIVIGIIALASIFFVYCGSIPIVRVRIDLLP